MSIADARLAARLCAIDPGLGGMVMRGGGETRDRIVSDLRDALHADAPLRRIPINVDDDRLSGGMDLAATLANGMPVRREGLLEEARGGVIVLPMAERMSDAIAGQIAAAIDAGGAFLTVAFDDGAEPEERPSLALAERLGFWLDLGDAAADEAGPIADDVAVTPEAEEVSEEALRALIDTAEALGINSARAAHFALRAARASAALAGRRAVEHDDLALAARLVLAPRATKMPANSEPPAPLPPEQSEDRTGEEEIAEAGPVEDMVLAAALAALPKDVLARITQGRTHGRANRAYGSGEQRKSLGRGRPLGARAGKPGGGVRLSLIDTLRSAAPWQKVRGRQDRIQIRREDLRIRRFQSRAQSVTIFAVDASGSSALARLAEAKGAVELLLAEAYVRRAEVALVAFRGTTAELLLPPTRSLTRARRSLAELPGGGGTPLAAGLGAAREMAQLAKARGKTPFVVVLTDGRANIAADGRAVRKAAEADATLEAKAIAQAGIAAVFVDISARPRPEGAALAAAMGARYLPLPRADAATMHAAVNAARPG